MMAQLEIIAALTPFLSTFGSKLTDDQWEQYSLALADVNPGDLDDALGDLRKTHGFRNAPLPAEILDRCDVHRKQRRVDAVREDEPVIQVTDGELRTITLKGIGSLTVRVLDDDHPALKRYACFECKDTGWAEDFHAEQAHPNSQPWFRRCGCVARNPVLASRRAKTAARRQAS